MPYRIVFTPVSRRHSNGLAARERAILLDTIAQQPQFEPLVETRNRKPMEPNELALWELRVGDLRVYYDVEEQADPVVLITAIDRKDRNEVWIEGKRVEL